MVRLGMVGIGNIAEDYISLFSKGLIEKGGIVALASRNQERLLLIKEKYHLDDVRLFTCLEDMLEDPELDAVIITTPHTLHPSMAEAVLLKGKHVLVDKPLGIRCEEAERLSQLSLSMPELRAGVMFNRRTSEVYQKVRDLIAGGEMGQMRRALWQVTNLYRTYAYYETSSWRGTYETEGGGVLMNQAVHQLDLLLSIIGMPREITAFMKEGFHRPMTTENDVLLNLDYENGATAQFLASTHESPGTNRLELSFDRGQILVTDDHVLKITRLREPEEEFARREKGFFTHVPHEVEEMTYPLPSNLKEQASLINNFMASVLGKEELICSFQEGKNSVRVINGAYLSAWTGRTVPVDFDLMAYEEAWQRKLKEKATESQS